MKNNETRTAYESAIREREDKMHEMYSEEEMSRMTTAEVLQIEARYGLYCGMCGHSNGCEYGVPYSPR